MTPRYLSEPAAWREIARRIAEGKWGESGLCVELAFLATKGRIDEDVFVCARKRVGAHLDDAKRTGHAWSNLAGRYGILGAWAFPTGEADVRVLAALFLALEAESEVA